MGKKAYMEVLFEFLFLTIQNLKTVLLFSSLYRQTIYLSDLL